MPNYVVRKLKDKPNGNFYICWTEGRRSQRETTGSAVKAEADLYFQAWLAQRDLRLDAQKAADGTIDKDHVPGKYTPVELLWGEYFERHVRRKTNSEASIGFAWNNLKPHFGHLLASGVTQTAVDAYIELRLKGRIGRVASEPSIRHDLAYLRACLNWAANPRRKLLDPSLLPAFDLPSAGEPRDRWLRSDEIDRLLVVAMAERQDRISDGELFLRIALETAARREAIMELTWDRIDFETNVIHFNVPGRTVTKKRRANVPISEALLPILQRADRERRAGKIVRLDERVVKIDIRRSLERYSKAARVSGLSPHVLRHTAATHMARRGVSLWIIAKVLGNSLVMVEKVYAKHCPEDLRDAVNLISNPLRGAL